MTTILIAEDNTMVGLLMQADLEDAGYAVQGPFARSGPALAAAAAARPDLALVDIDLADGDSGIDLAERFGGMSVPCLFVTGQSFDAAAAPEHALGVLGKPFPSAVLLETVALALRVAAGEPAPRNEAGVAWFGGNA